MNQILSIENKNNKKNNSPMDIKKIVLIFSIAIIIFGAIFVVEGVINANKGKSEQKNNIELPGEGIPTPTTQPTNEPLIDEYEPKVELILVGEKIRIIARDETEIDYIEYAWNDEETQIVKRESDKNKIEVVVDLRSGVNTLNVKAVDAAGNEFERSNDFEKKYKPKLKLWESPEGDAIILEASCEDGISRIDFTQNGVRYTLPIQDSNYTLAEFASIGVIPEYSEDGNKIVKLTYTYTNLLEGENRFSFTAYSTQGEVQAIDGTHTH